MEFIGIIWWVKKVYEAGQARGVNIEDRSTVLLILGIFGLGIISYAFIQDDLNKLANGN